MYKSLSKIFSYLHINWTEQLKMKFAESSLFVEDSQQVGVRSIDEILIEQMTCIADGSLCIEAHVQHLMSTKQVLMIEDIFEQHFHVPQVILKQNIQNSIHSDEKNSYLEHIDQWILKHAKLGKSLECRIFQQGRSSNNENALFWYMNENEYHIADKTNHWLLKFWYRYGSFPYEIVLKAEQRDNFNIVEHNEQLLEEANFIASELYSKDLAQLEAVKPMPTEPKQSTNNYRKKHRKSENVLWGKPGPEIPLIKISDIGFETDRALFEGQVFSFETKITKNERLLIKFAITDLTTSIECTLFADPEEKDELTNIIKNKYLKVTANVVYDDRFAKDFVARVQCIESAIKPESRKDNYPEKRVELHIHSKLSAKDGTINPKDIVKTASNFGHKAIAITDHGVVQGFPDVCEMADQLASQGHKIKIIYGVEGYLLDDGLDCFAFEVDEKKYSDSVVIFQLVTSGSLPNQNHILGIKALKLKFKNNEITDENENIITSKSLDFSSIDKLDNYQVCFSYDNQSDEYNEILFQNGFKREMIENAKSEIIALDEFSCFCENAVMIAENALHQLDFLRYSGFHVEGNNPRIKFNPPLIDFTSMKKHIDKSDMSANQFFKAEDLIQHFPNINVTDYSGLIALLSNYLNYLKAANISQLAELHQFSNTPSFEELRRQKKKTNHILLLAKDALGLYNLYRLCSDAHLKYFYYSPRIPRSVLSYYGTGIIKGMACVDGEIFHDILDIYKEAKGDFNQAASLMINHPVIDKAKQYSFLEIQPLTNNAFLLRKDDNYINTKEDLQNLNRLVIKLGELTNQLVCATGDVHFLNPEDDIYRKILMTNMNFDDMEEMADLYFRTTDEMLDEFSYLGSELAKEVVITNTNIIADSVAEDLRPFPKGSYPPLIQSADHDVRELTMEKAMDMYGYEGKLPDIVEARVKRELSSIIDNGFAIMYFIAHSVVKKSNDDGYIVGSRGSVGSSLVATLCGITEVNPLQPHYVCPNCKYSEFDDSGEYGSGFDLPAKKCPKCQHEFRREGQDIPFETFLGFFGDKQPDIDLNFSGFYQARAHQFIEEMFGSDKTFRAGTISSYAEKNSAGMVLNYFETNEKHVSKTEVSRLAQGLQGVKVTTGQHPGGMVVIPKERDIYDFTPIQYPANKLDCGIVTTHFDFNSLHDTILKLDILGHDDPSMLKMLGDITGIDVTTIPIPDEKVMSLFYSTAALGIPDEESTIKAATIGLPELGTFLVRSMIAETKPRKFYDLVQISGLSHGTDVWSGNAQDLIREGICTINEVIGCRDSIMTYLIYRGLPNKDSFDIMEKVRKGKGLSPEHEALMRENNIPEWYINSCKKIKYMFPKAHAVAYLISALRIAWFKVYYPEAFYCAFFTIRATEFSSDELCISPANIRLNRAEQRKNWNTLTAQQQKRHFYLELVEEMLARGIEFLPFDIDKCKATEFYSPEKGKIMPPFNAIPNISDALAQQIVKAREEGGSFRTQEELSRRAHLGQAAMEALAQTGILKDMPESAQIDLFSLL